MPYSEHELFTDPDGENLKLYRYLDFTKLVSLLRRHELFFCRTDRFSDPFEGSYPKREIEYRPIAERRAIRAIRGKYDPVKAQKNQEDMSKFTEALRSLMLLNCWHYNSQESLAMWKLYLKSDEGVAIETDFESYKNSFSDYEQNVYIGKVRYLDYEEDIFYEETEFPHHITNLFIPYIHKRKFFEHEKEYRAVIDVSDQCIPGKWLEYDWESEESVSGKFVPINLQTLVNRIIVSPYSSNWYHELVEETIDEILPVVPVVASEINMEPRF